MCRIPPATPEPASRQTDPGGVTCAARQPVTSLYIHVPFCGGKCSYCDFYSVADPDEDLVARWYGGLVHELERLAGEAGDHGVRLAPLRTLYLGGGTPSFLPPPMVRSLISRIRALFSLARFCDITLEANPESYHSRERAGSLEMLVAAGVNRISFGLQTSSDPLLASIGRRHTAGEAECVIRAASRAGFEHIAVDLMTGLPGQTLGDIRETLDFVASLPIDHVSSYALTLAEGTPLYARYRASPGCFPDEELEREMTHQVTTFLESHGFEHYEISNYAKPGARSRHNLVIWQADSYLAAGPAAASYMGGIRRVNPPSIDRWVKQVEAVGQGPFGPASIEEVVDERAARIETLVLGLRLLEGVSSSRFRQRHGTGLEEVFGEKLRTLEKRQLIALGSQGVRLTKKGLDFADLVARELL